MFVLKELNGLKLLEIEEFTQAGFKAFFTTKIGGVSQGNFQGLNLGLHNGDRAVDVLKNRELLAEALDLKAGDFTAAEQIHGNDVQLVTSSEIGRGALSEKDSICGADGLITAERDLPLISFYADCVPLYLADPLKKVVALAHAGWKGTVRKIARETFELMKERFGVRAEDCLAAIGPAISRDNYQVDSRVIKHFQEEFIDWREFSSYQGDDHYLLDLKEANRLLFSRMGIPENQIIVSNYCTYNDKDLFYSYRRDGGKTGRMASLIWF